MAVISKGFKGNLLLRKAGVPPEGGYTPERLQEIFRCSIDPVYFFRTYVKIKHVDYEAKVLFDPRGYQLKMIQSILDNRNTISRWPRQCGKALPLDTEIPTPSGWTTIGDIQPGDTVFDENGKPTKVTVISEIFRNRDCYKITFDDGSDVIADSEHLWAVRKANTKKRRPGDYKQHILTTQQLLDGGITRIDSRGKTVSKWVIETTKQVQYPSQEVLIDPYTLGVWLGDGSSADGRLTSSFDDLMHYKTNLSLPLSDNHSKKGLYTGTIYGLSSFLRRYGLINNKRIPTAYLQNDTATRLAVLQGLMDTDGHSSKSRNEITLTLNRSPKLIDDVQELLTSLGLKVFREYRAKANAVRLTFQCSKEQFELYRLPRKLEKQKETLVRADYCTRRFIRKIEKVDSVPTKCIGVDSPTHLFLCTRNFIPTHNTTVLAAVALHYLLFQRNHSILIAAHLREKSQDIVAAVQEMYMDLPSWLQQGVVEWNKRSFKLENGSRVKASATTSSSARGDTYNCIMLDEFAFVAHHLADDFLKSVIPTVASGKDTKIIITSTPKGLNMFYKVWESAINGDVPPPNNFVPIAVEWNEVPGRDEAFRAGIIAQYGQEYWDQEFACAFLGSSATLISAAKLVALAKMQPIKMTESTRLYEEPIKGHLYACTVDVAEGLGGDASVVMVFDVTTAPYKPVFIYQNRYLDVMALPGLISQVGRSYNDAMVLVESNFGQMVADILWRDFEYEHVIFTERTIKNPGGFKVGFGGKRQMPGVKMDVLTKRVGCSNLKSLIENDQLIIRDEPTIEELRRFAVKGKSYAAESGNDDLVMCLVLFGWLSEQGYLKSQNDVDVRGQIANLNRQKIEDNMLVTYRVDGSEDDSTPVASRDDKWLLDTEDPVMDPLYAEDLERFERWK